MKISKIIMLLLFSILLSSHKCEDSSTIDVLEENGYINLDNYRSNRDKAYISKSQNPKLSGHIEIPNAEFNSATGAACCLRAQLVASSPVFLGNRLDSQKKDRVWITIDRLTSDHDPRSDNVYHYRVPPLELPSNGEKIELSLKIDNRTISSTFIALDIQTIIIPIHFHIYKRPGTSVNSFFNELNLRGIVDGPNFVTDAATTSVLDPNTQQRTFKTQLKRKTFVTTLGGNIDDTWKKAKIQFVLKSYEVIENEDLERQIVSSNVFEFPPFNDHQSRRDIPGIHVYVGRNSENLSRGGFNVLAGALERANRCTINGQNNLGIVLARDRISSGSFTLAHEIGHFLGLDHTNESNGNCGSALLDVNDNPNQNLMATAAPAADLSTKQIKRAREVACLYLNYWGLNCP